MAAAFPDRERRKALVLERVRAGATVEAACVLPETAPAWTVRRWARNDPAFRAELDAAIARGRWRRLYAYDEAKAEAFLARARAGEPVNSLVGTPGMPGWKTYRHWKAVYAPFAEAVFALRQRRDTGLAARNRAKTRPFDAAAAERIVVRMHGQGRLADVLEGEAALPCREVVRRWRRETPGFGAVIAMQQAAWRRKRWAARLYDDEIVEAVLDHVRMGGSLASAGAVPGLPCRMTLYAWRKARPDFAAAVAEAMTLRERWYAMQIEDLMEAAWDPARRRAALAQARALKARLGRIRPRRGAGRRPRGPGSA